MDDETHGVKIEQKPAPKRIHADHAVAETFVVLRLLREDVDFFQFDRRAEDLEAQRRDGFRFDLNTPPAPASLAFLDLVWAVSPGLSASRNDG